MTDFLDFEASESDNSENEDLDPHERRKLKKIKAVSDSEDEDEDDDEDRIREELKDLIDDNPIDEDEESDANSDTSRREKRKSRSDDELDDRLEDDDYDLLEENLGVKVQRRKRFKRLKRALEDSDAEGEEDADREAIANQLFDDEDGESRRSLHSHSRMEADNYDEMGEDEESDADDFIVDDDGRPITEKKKRTKRIFNDANLQEGQDIFGVDFDYDEFEKYGDEDYAESESEEDYEDDDADGEREKRPKKVAKNKMSRKTIFEIYEPSELKRGHFTDVDNEIRKTDIPERMQLRDIPITAVPENSTELEDEAEWIYKQAFTKSTISNRSEEWTNGDERKPSSAIGKIKQALDFMRNQQLEVPFIAFYRKEYVQPELNINDLWKVYQYDAKWCQLLTRKKALATLFEKMRNFQLDQIMAIDSDCAIPDDVRLINDNDIERLNLVQTPEELRDVHNHFLLHYAHEIPAMQQVWRQKEKEKRRIERLEVRRKQLESLEEGVELPPEIPEEEDDIEAEETLKSARDSGPYSMCRKSGILGLAKRFGLTPEQFAENLRDNYQRHDVEQEPLEPTEVAKEYVSKRFQTVDEILHAVKFVVARQISREPMLRKSVRETYYERAKICVVPTKRGQKEIDENHPIYALKYLKNKPVRDLVGDQFLKLSMAEEDKLITLTISETIDGHISSSSYLEEVKQFYQRDEFSKNVQEWNALRASCVEEAIVKMVLPDLRKELRSILLAEAKENVLAACAQKLCEWIKPAPYTITFPDEDEEDWETTKGVRVCGFAFDDDPAQASFCAIINPEGEVTDYLRLSKFASRRGKLNIDEEKDPDTFALVNFLRTKKPHVIVVGGESLKALKIQRDLQEIITFLVDEEQFPKIAVEIVNNDLAKMYANSKKSNADFREYPIVLRQAISVARRLQDPLIEYSQLCTTDEEISCLRYHPLQDQLSKEDLLEVLNLEFVNRTNEVGVDVNLAVQNSLTSNLVQFVCGLGPRKGQALLKILKQTNQRLENRTQLVTHCHMGPRVFINCSGFIKIDTNSLGDSTETYVEVLDGSRVHPETYEWARKMAVDALEYDDEDDANPAGALEEILESPERLKDLDLDAFAVELERQGFGNKSITLYDIRNELNSRYKDLRPPYRSPSREELFEILAKETPTTFYVGKLVLATVIGFVHRKPQGDQLDNADPEENAETGLWQCPFCLKNDFPELSEVWNHFDAGACPGQASGIRVLLENGITGFIHLKNLSDKHVKHPEERVQIGQAIHCRIIKIDPERFSVDCSSKSSDLLDRNGEWRPKKDHYYDEDLEDKEMKMQDETKKQAERQQYTRRIIVHPAFHNKSYAEAIKIMATMDQGEVIIRPSSKGSDHLTVTWKVCNEIYQHIDVREEGKENAFSLGSSLWIGNDEFEDLDEIIARHVTPMAAYARDLLGYKYYRDSAGGMKDKMEELLKEEKKKNPNKIHYFISASKNYPGNFLLSYLPRGKIRHEYVSVTPEGFRFRQQMFDSLNSLLKWFKEHFKDPIPTATPAVITPRSVTNSTRSSFATPALSQSSIASDAINKVARNMPSHMLHSLTQVANKTPHYPNTPGYGGQSSYVNTPYTPSGQTPFMTPYQTPHHAVQTPRYGQATPSNSNSNGTFAQPRPPQSSRASRSSQYHQSSHTSHSKNAQQWSNQRPQSAHRSSPHVPSPRNRFTPTHGSRPSHHSSYQSHHSKNPSGSINDDDDWEKGSASWEAASRNRQSKKPTAAPATSYDDDWDDGPNNWEAQISSKATPRSVRSTPRTDTSPRSMTLGDATPLYDENI